MLNNVWKFVGIVFAVYVVGSIIVIVFDHVLKNHKEKKHLQDLKAAVN